ncbi:hypothetical protein [uncultured Brevundimonas sp.]|uniref:hypothetical protein n=1 Tax=uncultured Brevundimonas sp. TaxID=213418 RepID=UPI002622BFDB|nr:hypothetical protein [uncultured Brevundimonas sp.]
MLNVAGALESVTANTAIDDSSIFYCSPALAHADAESSIASKYLAGTIMFSFVWMALEQTILEIAPKGKGTAGARGRLVFASPLAVDLDLDGPLKLTWRFTHAVGDMQADLRVLGGLLPAAPRAEVAFELVRRVRNAFSHGTLMPPQPNDWGEGVAHASTPEIDRFFGSTRLSLMLIALLLANNVRSGTMASHPEDGIYVDDEDEYLEEVPIVWALRSAHLADPWLPPGAAARTILELNQVW